MRFSQIHSFYMVAKLGTYQAAAERLNASQPTISARILALEDRLQTKLFNRSGYRVALTPQGRAFLDYAERMLELQRAALHDLQCHEELSGTIRIGVVDPMISIWLADFLMTLERSHPRLGIELIVRASPLLQEDLLSQTIDAAFTLAPILHADATNIDFCDCPMALVAAPALALHGRRLGPGDLAGMNLLTSEKVTRPYESLRRLMKQHNVSAKLNPISALNSVILLTRKGLGIGHVPLAAVEDELARGDLVVLDITMALPELRFTMSYLDGPQKAQVETISAASMEFLKARAPAGNINLLF
ncbi:LysR family transcriptional regulator [Chachezhania sediminis]|uniref:LysR family transcriptional regulator n=1 Tax=Chachezhania sediminis TaxID=2599291 RepID=UPI00131D24A8|nr:LysR family transcriptional regulator [Chachezhania sediminis]